MFLKINNTVNYGVDVFFVFFLILKNIAQLIFDFLSVYYFHQ